jgi:hypothetical protein
VSPTRGGDDPILAALMASIETQESGGNPSARNTRTGAYGRYQILPSNWEPWSREALGRVVERTPENQHRVAQYKLAQYTREFGPEGAAVAWYAGPARARQWLENPNDPWFDRRHGDVDPETGERKEPSVRQYVQEVTGRMGQIQQQAPQPDRSAQLATALRNAHAAGDTAAAQRLAAALVQTRGQAQPPQQDPGAQGEQFTTPEQWDMLTGQAPPPEEPSARQRGAEFYRGLPERSQRARAVQQGAGSGAFGIGTPLTAVQEIVRSRLNPNIDPVPVGDAMEYARGIRGAAQEAEPGGYYGGMALGMGASMAGGAQVLRAAPAAVQGVVRMGQAAEGASRRARFAQGAANTARLSGTGAAAAGVTAGLEEGAGAVPWAAGVGAAAGPALVGGAKAGAWGWKRFGPGDRAALEVIAKRLKEPVDDVARRLGEVRQRFGRGANVAETVGDRTAEELALIAQVPAGARAGRVFREAEEAAARARPGEVSGAIRQGGPTTSVPAEQARLAPIQQEAREVVGRRTAEHAGEVTGRQTIQMNRAMGAPGTGEGFGDHMVPLSKEFADEFLKSPEVWSILPTPFRQRIGRVLEAGEKAGSVNLSVRDLDSIRQELSRRAGAGAGMDFSRLSRIVRDYTGKHVPEYERALTRYGITGDVVEGAGIGAGVLGRRGRAFIDKLRTAGGGTAAEPTRPGSRARQQVGARRSARAELADALDGSPEETAAFMARWSSSPQLQRNTRNALSRNENAQLDDILRRYRNQLDVTEGAQVGRRGIMLSGESETFAAEAAGSRATPGGAQGVERSARGRLADAAGENPLAAAAVAEGMAEHPGLQQRIATAFGAGEAERLRGIGETATRARRNLAAMAPRNTEAHARRMAQAQDVQTLIGMLVVSTGRASGAMRANIAHRMIQRFQMSPRTAERAAELLVDPEQAPAIINYLRNRGMTTQQILDMYQAGAAAAGITVGAGS